MTTKQIEYMVNVERLTAREIASILGVTRNAVQMFCRDHGIKVNGKPQGFKKTKKWAGVTPE